MGHRKEMDKKALLKKMTEERQKRSEDKKKMKAAQLIQSSLRSYLESKHLLQ